MKFWPLLSHLNSLQILGGLSLSIVVTLVSYRFKAISFSGAWGIVVIGTIVFGLGGILFAVPLIFFFISSSLFTSIKTLGKTRTLKILHKSGPRDFRQVMANGGIGALFVIVYFLTGNIVWFFPYLASLCEAASDTWATELGTLHPDSPVSIVTLKKVEPGQSGGITLLGTLAAIAGSLVTMFVARPFGFLNPELIHFSTKFWLIAANCGLAGSLFDSVLGGSIQAQYRCSNCRHIVEQSSHCNQPATLVRGFGVIGNDFINFTSATFAALASTLILIFGF